MDRSSWVHSSDHHTGRVPAGSDRKENVIFLGPAGVGKTHLAVSLAIAAAERGKRVYYGTLADLVPWWKRNARVG